MSAKLPWYPWYPQHWLTDTDVRELSLVERGLYREMLDYQAIDGSLPDDPVRVARIIGVGVDEVVAAWPAVRRFFATPLDDGRLRNPKLAGVLEDARRVHEARSAAGRRGGKQKAARARRKGRFRLLAGLRFCYKQTSSKRLSRALAITVTIHRRISADIETTNTPCCAASQRVDDFVSSGGEGERSAQPALFAESVPGVTGSGPARLPVHQTKLPLNVQRDEAARALLAAAWPLVKANVPDLAMNERTWRQRNKAAALALVEAEKTPAQVCAALKCAYTHPISIERGFHMVVMLSVLQERWHVLSGIARGDVKPFGTATSAREMQSRDRRAARRGVASDV